MSRLRQALHNDLQALEFIRDELKLQSHLFKAEAQKTWEDMEGHWDDLKQQLNRAKTAAANAEPEIEAAARKLAETLKAGYEGLKKAVTP